MLSTHFRVMAKWAPTNNSDTLIYVSHLVMETFSITPTL